MIALANFHTASRILISSINKIFSLARCAMTTIQLDFLPSAALSFFRLPVFSRTNELSLFCCVCLQENEVIHESLFCVLLENISFDHWIQLHYGWSLVLGESWNVDLLEETFHIDIACEWSNKSLMSILELERECSKISLNSHCTINKKYLKWTLKTSWRIHR
jgi:hypothetical protein